MGYEPRVYRRHAASPDLVGFAVSVAETDLYIQAEVRLVEEALTSVKQVRGQIERHTRRYPDFATSLAPRSEPKACPAVVATMYRAAQRAGTGPMAAVAGASAE